MKKNKIILLLMSISLITVSTTADPLSDAQTCYDKGDYQSAIRLYKKSVLDAPSPALVYFNMANCWFQLDSFANAIVCYEQSLSEAPSFFRAWLNLGIARYTLNDYPGVIAALERARLLEPENTQLLLILASSYRKLGSYSYSIPLLEEAVSIDTSLEKCYFMLYEANYSLGNLEQAAQWLRRCPENIDKPSKEKYTLLAELAQERGKINEALSWLKKVIHAFSDDQWALYRYISVLASDGTVLLALEEADEALERFPAFGEMALLAGTLATKEGMLERATNYFLKAWKNGLSDGMVGLKNLIVLYQEKNDRGRVEELRAIITSKKL